MSKTERNNNFWLLIIVAIVCGLAAGILGQSFSRSYSLNDYTSFAGELNLSDINANNPGFVIRDAKKVVVNQDVKTTETLNSIRPVVVSVFKEIPESSPLDSRYPGYYKMDEPIFIGLIITSDGWVVAAASSDLKLDLKAKSYVAITGDRQLYKIDKFSNLNNSAGDLLVFHLAGANNLPVKKIVPRSELVLGQSLLVVNGFNSAWPTYLTSFIKSPTVLSSDILNAHLGLSGIENNDLEYSFVFDLSGNLVAVVSDNKQIIPAFAYNSAWQSLFKKEAPQQPYLGVNYLDLNVVKTEALNITKGAWLYPSEDAPAVIPGSPAASAGLLAGDVITWVNNYEIDSSNDLADIIAGYQPGDKIILTYLRDGVEKEVEVQLAAYK